MKKWMILLGTWMVAGFVWGQGNLTPSGSPSPLMKTLLQVEPRTDVSTLPGDATSEIIISDPGSYYLSRDVLVRKTYGILIDAPRVTLDLNGFQIIRSAGSAGEGIRIDGGRDGATIRNGTVNGFDYGIRGYSVPDYARGCLIQEIAVSDCTSYGIRAGKAATVDRCRAYGNTGNAGIYAGEESTVVDCVADQNQVTYAIRVDGGSSIVGCSAHENEGTYAIYALGHASIRDCRAYFNQASYGMYAGGGSTFRDCDAQGNYGTDATSYGIYLHSQGAVLRCVAKSNSNTNSQSNAALGVGIYGGDLSTITDCTAVLNRGDGIRVATNSHVTRNSCLQNGHLGDGAGIHVQLSGNHIDGNTVTENDRGVDVDTALNLVARNTARGNGTNYDLVANTRNAQILAPAVSGFTSTDPWANFSF